MIKNFLGQSIDVLVVILFFLGLLATPIAVVYGIYQWTVVDLHLKAAVWVATKVWFAMLFCFVLAFLLAKFKD